MIIVQMTYHSPILVMTTPTKCLIQGGVNFGKGDWTGSRQALSILITFGT